VTTGDRFSPTPPPARRPAAGKRERRLSKASAQDILRSRTYRASVRLTRRDHVLPPATWRRGCPSGPVLIAGAAPQPSKSAELVGARLTKSSSCCFGPSQLASAARTADAVESSGRWSRQVVIASRPGAMDQRLANPLGGKPLQRHPRDSQRHEEHHDNADPEKRACVRLVASSGSSTKTCLHPSEAGCGTRSVKTATLTEFALVHRQKAWLGRGCLQCVASGPGRRP
jgi:hypothetical protein